MNSSFEDLNYVIIMIIFLSLLIQGYDPENYLEKKEIIPSNQLSNLSEIKKEKFENSPNIFYLLNDKFVKIEENGRVNVNNFNSFWENYAMTFTIKPNQTKEKMTNIIQVNFEDTEKKVNNFWPSINLVENSTKLLILLSPEIRLESNYNLPINEESVVIIIINNDKLKLIIKNNFDEIVFEEEKVIPSKRPSNINSNPKFYISGEWIDSADVEIRNLLLDRNIYNPHYDKINNIFTIKTTKDVKFSLLLDSTNEPKYKVLNAENNLWQESVWINIDENVKYFQDKDYTLTKIPEKLKKMKLLQGPYHSKIMEMKLAIKSDEKIYFLLMELENNKASNILINDISITNNPGQIGTEFPGIKQMRSTFNKFKFFNIYTNNDHIINYDNLPYKKTINNKYNYQEAVEACDKEGLRLCSKDEIKKINICNTGWFTNTDKRGTTCYDKWITDPIAGLDKKGSAHCCYKLGSKKIEMLDSDALNYPLNECQTDCNTDSDCKDNLKCYNNKKGESHIPSGCYGELKNGFDICYDPNRAPIKKEKMNDFDNKYGNLPRIIPDKPLMSIESSSQLKTIEGFSNSEITKIIYLNSRSSYLNGTIDDLMPNKNYSIKVNVLRSDLGGRHEKVNYIKLNGKSIGECNPPGSDYSCDFYNCYQNDFVIKSDNKGKISVEAQYQGHSPDCYCDQNNKNGNCRDERLGKPSGWKHTVAAIKFILNPDPTIVSATQSSTGWNGSASRIVRSNDWSDNYGDRKCTHTNGKGWLRAELDGLYTVSEVQLLNRGDCCSNRIKNAKVYVLNGETRHLCGSVSSGNKGWLTVACPATAVGRTIEVSTEDTNQYLTLCGMKVKGNQEDPILDDSLIDQVDESFAEEDKEWSVVEDDEIPQESYIELMEKCTYHEIRPLIDFGSNKSQSHFATFSPLTEFLEKFKKDAADFGKSSEWDKEKYSNRIYHKTGSNSGRTEFIYPHTVKEAFDAARAVEIAESAKKILSGAIFVASLLGPGVVFSKAAKLAKGLAKGAGAVGKLAIKGSSVIAKGGGKMNSFMKRKFSNQLVGLKKVRIQRILSNHLKYGLNKLGFKSTKDYKIFKTLQHFPTKASKASKGAVTKAHKSFKKKYDDVFDSFYKYKQYADDILENINDNLGPAWLNAPIKFLFKKPIDPAIAKRILKDDLPDKLLKLASRNDKGSKMIKKLLENRLGKDFSKYANKNAIINDPDFIQGINKLQKGRLNDVYLLRGMIRNKPGPITKYNVNFFSMVKLRKWQYRNINYSARIALKKSRRSKLKKGSAEEIKLSKQIDELENDLLSQTLLPSSIKERIKWKAMNMPLTTFKAAAAGAIKSSEALNAVCKLTDNISSGLGMFDANLGKAFDACSVIRDTEETFHRIIRTTRIDSTTNKPTFRKLEHKFGTESSDSYGHIYGLHTFGEICDEPGTIYEYPVNVNVVLFSLANVQPPISDEMREENGVAKDNDFVAKPFLSANSNSNFDEEITNDSVWVIRRVKNIYTHDFDYVGNLNVGSNKSMGQMVYCIWHKKKEMFLKNNFKFQESNTGNDLVFSKTFIPTTCGWIIRRVEGHQNNYTLFSMNRYFTRPSQVGETLLDIVTLDFVSPIARAIENSIEYPYNLEHKNAYFSSLSTENYIDLQNEGTYENSWMIVELDNPAFDDLKSSNLNVAETNYDNDLDYNQIRVTCSSSSSKSYCYDVSSGSGMTKKGQKELKFCDTNYKQCRAGRSYNEFCNAFKGSTHCGKDTMDKQLTCVLNGSASKFNACRYTPGTQKRGEFCGIHADCEYWYCDGTDEEKEKGLGICQPLRNGAASKAITGCKKDKYCASGYNCGGWCSCIPKDKHTPNPHYDNFMTWASDEQKERGICPEGYYCSSPWGNSTRKCEPHNEYGVKESAQSLCGDNRLGGTGRQYWRVNSNGSRGEYLGRQFDDNTMAYGVTCKNGYSCDGHCSCTSNSDCEKDKVCEKEGLNYKVCEWGPGTRKEGETCKKHKQCQGHLYGVPGTLACCDGTCQKAVVDWAGFGYCPSECKGRALIGTPPGTCHLHNYSNLTSTPKNLDLDSNEKCIYDENCKDTHFCNDDWQCELKKDNGFALGTAQVGCGTGNALTRANRCKSGYACGGYCSCRPSDCGDQEYCDYHLMSWGKPSYTCKEKQENGTKTGYAQTGCGSNNDYADKCLSGYACNGYCSCKASTCNSDEYCDYYNMWFRSKTYKCKAKLSNGSSTGHGQVGCGKNNGYAIKCKSGWSCGGYCSCKKNDCEDDEYCDHHLMSWGKPSYKCKSKKSNGAATGYAQVGCGNNNDYADKCESNWACNGYCACKSGCVNSSNDCVDKIKDWAGFWYCPDQVSCEWGKKGWKGWCWSNSKCCSGHCNSPKPRDSYYHYKWQRCGGWGGRCSGDYKCKYYRKYHRGWAWSWWWGKYKTYGWGWKTHKSGIYKWQRCRKSWLGDYIDGWSWYKYGARAGQCGAWG